MSEIIALNNNPINKFCLYQAMLTWPEYHESNLQLLLEKEVSILQDEETADSGGQAESAAA